MNRSAHATLERRFRHYTEADTPRDKVLCNLLEIAEEYERAGKLEQTRIWLDLSANWELRSVPVYR